MGESIKIGTLAPKSSPWGKVFETWIKAVNEKSAGNLELQFFYNGAQGDEAATVGKIKSGQLDGAVVTAVGLGKVYKPILALQMPLFTSWGKCDRARDALRGDFERGARDAGFAIAGWGDVGLVRVFSRGAPLRAPEELKGRKPWYSRNDLVLPALYSVLGVSGVPLGVPDVLPSLKTGAIDVVLAPALAVEQMQWASGLGHVTDMVVGAAIGAVALSQKRLDALPPDLRTILLDTGKVACAALAKRIRAEDSAAMERLRAAGKVSALDEGAVERWRGVSRQTRQRLAQGTFAPELVARLEELAA